MTAVDRDEGEKLVIVDGATGGVKYAYTQDNINSDNDDTDDNDNRRKPRYEDRQNMVDGSYKPIIHGPAAARELDERMRQERPQPPTGPPSADPPAATATGTSMSSVCTTVMVYEDYERFPGMSGDPAKEEIKENPRPGSFAADYIGLTTTKKNDSTGQPGCNSQRR